MNELGLREIQLIINIPDKCILKYPIIISTTIRDYIPKIETL